MSNNDIHRIAKSLIATHETSDPFVISNALGIEVILKPLGNLKGFYIVQHDIPYIVINDSLDYITSRIICAHELGHDRLHRELAQTRAFNEFELYIVHNKAELEANTFAAHLLIEDDAVAILRRYNYDLAEASALLNTTPELLAIKIADGSET